MILRKYHISVIAVFLLFTNARTIQSAPQSEVFQNQDLPVVKEKAAIVQNEVCINISRVLLKITWNLSGPLKGHEFNP